MPTETRSARDFWIGEWLTRPGLARICRDAEEVHITPRAMSVLLYLAERPGQAISRNQILDAVWPRMTVTPDALSQCIVELRRAFRDDAKRPTVIETIPKLGIRLMLSPRPAETVAENTAPSAPRIAVLPFVNMSSDEENEHFADGLTEELVDKLSAIRGLRVVARTSAFHFKGTRETASTIARALQVDHLLEGSVRGAGARVRITAQLIDAHRDEHIWSQTFDRDVGDVFRIQEEIAHAVAAALRVSLLDADASRVHHRGTTDPQAHRLNGIARAHLWGRTKTPDISLARQLLDQAIARDPNFAAPYAGIARYHYRKVASTLADADESERLGAAAAQRAVALDPQSSEARQARANFGFWSHRVRGHYGDHLAAESDIQYAIELDPSNSGAFEDFGRSILWHAPNVALGLLERAIQIDPLCTFPNVLIATLLGNLGRLDAARKRCSDLLERAPDAAVCAMAIGTLETYFGHFEQAVPLLQASVKFAGGAARIQLWSVHLSVGDRDGASQWLDFGGTPMEHTLSIAARFAMDGRHEAAYALLAHHRTDYPLSRLLDLPTAKFALITGKPREALEILEQRLPDLVSGVEPISARNVLPALDVATAQVRSGADAPAQRLLERVAAHLDGPDVLRLPLFAFQRARAHALAHEPAAALRALDRAYDEGLRTTWALDLRPQSFLYIDPIDADPAFDELRDDARLARWFARIAQDHARQRDLLRAATSDMTAPVQ